jgi:hypothetical protein
MARAPYNTRSKPHFRLLSISEYLSRFFARLHRYAIKTERIK